MEIVRANISIHLSNRYRFSIMELNSLGCLPLWVSVADTRALLVTLCVVRYPLCSKKSIEEGNSFRVNKGFPEHIPERIWLHR